jgi:hypothetical protein
MDTKMGLKGHFHHNGAGRTPLHAVADLELHGVLRLRAENRSAILNTPLRMTIAVKPSVVGLDL